MAEIPHAYTAVTSEQTSTSDSYGSVAGSSISSSNFTSGRKYLIRVTAQLRGSNINANFYCQLLHGSTAFTGSEYSFQPGATSTYYTYDFFTVWTAVSSEGLQLQFKCETAGHTVGADQITMVAIEISEDLTENTDWFFSENTTSTSLTTSDSSSNNASITFTPGSSGDYYILCSGSQDPSSSGKQSIMKLIRSGEASDTVSSIIEGEDTTVDRYIQTVMKVYSLGASSNTFTQKSSVTVSDGGSRSRSAVFAIRLDVFEDYSFAHTAGTLSIDTTDDFSTGTNAQTDSFTPAQTGDWYLSSFGILEDTLARFRQQIDNSDDPASQTSDLYDQQRTYDPNDEIQWAIQAVSNLNTSSHTLDFDVTSRVSGQTMKERLVVAFSMQLADGGGGGGGPPARSYIPMVMG